MVTREGLTERLVSTATTTGLVLAGAWVLSFCTSEISTYIARLDVVSWMLDGATLLSVPWEVVATIFVILRWRDLPQRFWTVYCFDGFLAYKALPLYLFHFGIYW